ncbi:MAG: PspC domain-containing protein [Nocardioides sp.]|nr:PspC domain-containing protein [Nocardioides sp.]
MSSPPSRTPAECPVRRAHRSTTDRWVGGVAAGLADHLGQDARVVRVLFVAATLVGGLGVVLYAGLWLTLPTDRRFIDTAPGIAAAERQGKRTRASSRWADNGLVVALVVLALGILLFLQLLSGRGFWLWPVVLGLGGVALLWRQADEAQAERWSDTSDRLDPLRALVGQGGAAAYARIGAGAVLLVLALVLFAARSGEIALARDVVLTALLAVVGIGLVLAPWLLRLAGDLSSERAERIRSQARADMAAHLHDSVLQTLALIQKHAGDERAVSTLARGQERDLRRWMYGDEDRGAGTFAAELRRVAAEVDDAHGVPVEVVVVGDRGVQDRSRAVVLAAREAMTNAARHAGAPRVDVYAEVASDGVEVFVRDRGAGFDPADVAEDRLGIRNSISGRMERHGGRASVRSTPGEGTEVRLVMPLPDPDRGPDHEPDPGHDEEIR